MAINLTKGQTINLEKDQFDLSAVTLGLGWDVKKQKKGFLSTLFSNGSGSDYDLDAVAFLLNAEGKIQRNAAKKPESGDVIYFNNLTHASGNIYHTGDNRTGDGDGDDEQLVVKLNALAPQYDKIVFLVTIYQGKEKNQHFGLIDNAFIRAVDAKGKEMLRFDLSNDASFNNMRSMLFGELYRKNGGWKFRALGTPYETDNFVDILNASYL